MSSGYIILPVQGGGGGGTVTSVSGTSPIKGNNTGSTANAADLTQAQVSVMISPEIRTSYLFQPGGTASPQTGTYTSWSALYTDLIQTAGCKRYVTIDDSLGTATIPSGTYNLEGVTLRGTTNSPTLNLADGCVFSAWDGAEYNLSIVSNSNSPVYTIDSAIAQVFLEITDNVTMQAQGSAPFVEVPAGGFLVFIMSDIAGLNSGASAVIDIANGANLFLYMTVTATVNDDTISGAAGADTLGFLATGSSSFSNTQTAYLGAIAVELVDLSKNHFYDNTGTTLVSVNAQDAITELSGDVAPQTLDLSVGTNSLTAETTIKTINVTLPAIQTAVQITASGSYAANTNAKTLKLYANGSVIHNSGSLVANNGRWTFQAVIAQTNSGYIQANTMLTSNLAVLTDQQSRVTSIASTVNTSFVVEVTGQATANADISGDLLYGTLVK